MRCLLRNTVLIVLTLGFAATVAGYESFDAKASSRLAKLGSIAAGFNEVSAGTSTPDLVREKFAEFDSDVVEIVLRWSTDEELIDAPPAFRRFLMFEYITEGTDMIAAASNPDELLINLDASVEIVFEDHPEIIDWAQQQMKNDNGDPQHTLLAGHSVSVYPMVPNADKADSCIACHASDEVGRPYPKGKKVLGYTFVAMPSRVQ